MIKTKLQYRKLIKYTGLALVVVAAQLSLTHLPALAECATVPTTYGSSTLTFTAPSDGTYTVWSRIMAPDTQNNSFFLKTDTNCDVVVGDGSDVSANTWKWINYQNGAVDSPLSLSLTAGPHTLVVTGREENVKIDRLLLVQDSCVPADLGDNCGDPIDAFPPSVSMVAPANGSTVSGTIPVTATATDNTGVTKVEFYLDGVLGTSVTASPYSYQYDTTKSANGMHTFTAKAYDAAGNSRMSTPVTFTVNNVVADVTAPTVSFSQPVNGAVLRTGNIIIKASAKDNVAVKSVALYIDGKLNSTVNSSALTVTWNANNRSMVGQHTLKAVATDTSNNTATSQITITIKR